MAEPQRITPALICKYQLSQSITSARTQPGLQSGAHPVQHGLVRPGDGWWCIAIGEDRRGRPPDCCSRSSSDPAACLRGAAPEFLRPGRYRRPGLDRSGTRPWRKSPYAPPVRVAAWGHEAEPRLLAGRVLFGSTRANPADRQQLPAEQIKLPAQQHELPEYRPEGRPVVVPEVGDVLKSGFRCRSSQMARGRPGYAPADLLKLYIYG
jgi:hypothetical protein